MGVSSGQIIRAEGLGYRYRGSHRQALEDVEFSVERGELFGILGPTGAGKSTLLQCLCGVIPFYSRHGERAGRVYVKGKEVTEYRGLDDITGSIGLVLQDPEVQLFNLHVRDELAWGLENRGVPPNEIIDIINRTAEVFGIGDLLDRVTYTLSGGEKQRVVVASVFALKPDIVLLDEPTSELDPIGTEMVFEAAGALASEGVTVVMVEHKVEQLAAYADRLAILEAGRLTEVGAVRDVFQSEASARLHRSSPQVFQLGQALRERGFALEELPLTVDQAVEAYEYLANRHRQKASRKM